MKFGSVTKKFGNVTKMFGIITKKLGSITKKFGRLPNFFVIEKSGFRRMDSIFGYVI